MTRSLCIALLACAVLPGCASIDSASGGSTAVASAGTYYCWKDRLYESDGKMMCNWTDSLKSACELSMSRGLAKGDVASGPTTGKRCANGQELIQVTMK